MSKIFLSAFLSTFLSTFRRPKPICQCDRNGGGDDVIHIIGGSELPGLGENSGDNDNGDDDDDDGDDDDDDDDDD